MSARPPRSKSNSDARDGARKGARKKSSADSKAPIGPAAPTPSKGEAQKTRILSTAITLLSKRGIEGASFQAIANELGISQGAVLHHFANKSDLLEEAWRRIISHDVGTGKNAILAEDDGLTRIRKYFRETIEWKENYRQEAQVMLLLYFYATFDLRFAKFYSSVVQGARERLRGYLLAARREKLFSKDIDVEQIAAVLHEAMMGGLINTIVEEKTVGYEKALLKKWERLLADLLALQI